jgi:hypothetical protein
MMAAKTQAKKGTSKSAPKKVAETHIHIAIVGEGYVRKGTIVAERGDLAALHSFDYIEGSVDWNAKVAVAMTSLQALEITPPPVIKATPSKVAYAAYEQPIPDTDWGCEPEAVRYLPEGEYMVQGKTSGQLRTEALLATAAKVMNVTSPNTNLKPLAPVIPMPSETPASKEATQLAMF